MNLITCTGYGGTGSSVISDLLKEYEGVKSMGDFEFSLAHEVDGISDLQHSIVDDFNRLKTTEAIYRFKKLANLENRYYSKFFGHRFADITQSYIDSLTEVKWNGFYHQHPRRYPRFFRLFKYNIPNRLWHVARRFLPSNGYEPKELHPRSEMILSQDSVLFFDATRKYFHDLLTILSEYDKYENLVLDQLVPPFHTERYSKYFDNIKIIIIDRDPRDLYILNKKYWNEGWIPTDDVDTYIKWFELIRREQEVDTKLTNVLFIRFEDCILNYDDSVSKIESFLGLDGNMHTRPKKFFDPSRSIRNMRLWEHEQTFSQDIKKIASFLPQYCYQ